MDNLALSLLLAFFYPGGRNLVVQKGKKKKEIQLSFLGLEKPNPLEDTPFPAFSAAARI